MPRTLAFRVLDEDRTVTLAPEAVVVAGFTGRDRREVDEHVQELAALGIPTPESVPAFWSVTPDLLAVADEINVGSAETSGEAEPVLVCDDGRWYVAVGSDHTARDIERTDYQRSKEACPKVLSRDVVTYERAQDGWDDASLRSWALEDGQEVLYQDGTLAKLLRVPDTLTAMRAQLPVQGRKLVVFLGTVPLHRPSYVFGSKFRAELHFPAPDIVLQCQYRVTHRRD